ncbi:uncharacterized protein LOC114318646 [Camellia sinensis]|uniref:uncharacterized protein LOC114318646 n=1 Tax=Camellia sinensis TaxID=4442 RepID=UPI0010364D83|nr:uncharacterized protein LOC114318646 [Camellia sinensis]
MKLLKERNVDTVLIQEKKKEDLLETEVQAMWVRDRMEFMAMGSNGSARGLLCIWDPLKSWKETEAVGWAGFILLSKLKALKQAVKEKVWRLNKIIEWIWLQNLRLNWALKDDRNTRFFHVVARSRQSRNELTSLTVGDSMIEDPAQVRNEVFDHFKKQFAEDWVVRPKLGGLFKSVQYSPQFAMLEAEFLEAEIKAAVKDCDGNKAPGPNGFNLLCLQKFWKVMKGDLISFMKDFHKNGRLVRGLNSSFITLVPKKENPVGLSDFRPINIVGSVYKVLTKVLSKKLKIVFPSMISETQSAFLRGRNILDVLVNGSPTNEFYPQTGLRQGDPMSHLLVSLVAKGLNMLLTRAYQIGIIKGVKIGIGGVVLSHLQFANDSLFLCETEDEEVKSLKRILRCFEVISGLRINYHKSQICGMGVPDESLASFASILNWSNSTLLEYYMNNSQIKIGNGFSVRF